MRLYEVTLQQKRKRKKNNRGFTKRDPRDLLTAFLCIPLFVILLTPVLPLTSRHTRISQILTKFLPQNQISLKKKNKKRLRKKNTSHSKPTVSHSFPLHAHASAHTHSARRRLERLDPATTSSKRAPHPPPFHRGIDLPCSSCPEAVVRIAG